MVVEEGDGAEEDSGEYTSEIEEEPMKERKLDNTRALLSIHQRIRLSTTQVTRTIRLRPEFGTENANARGNNP